MINLEEKYLTRKDTYMIKILEYNLSIIMRLKMGSFSMVHLFVRLWSNQDL